MGRVPPSLFSLSPTSSYFPPPRFGRWLPVATFVNGREKHCWSRRRRFRLPWLLPMTFPTRRDRGRPTTAPVSRTPAPPRRPSQRLPASRGDGGDGDWGGLERRVAGMTCCATGGGQSSAGACAVGRRPCSSPLSARLARQSFHDKGSKKEKTFG